VSDPATTNLLQQVHDYLLQVYSSGRSGTTNQQLAFEPIGVPLSSEMFKVNPTDTALSPEMAIEVLSDLSNVVPEVDNGTFFRGLRTLEAAYEVMLFGSTPLTASDAGFAHIKSEAQQSFGDTLGSLQPAGSPYRAVHAIPIDWYDTTHEQNWTTHTFNEGTPPANQPAPPATPPLTWHRIPPHFGAIVAQRQTFFAANSELVSAPPPSATASATKASLRPMTMMRAPIATVGSGAVIARPLAAAPVASATVAQPASTIVRPIAAAYSAAVIVSQTTPQNVSGSGLSLSFEYCLVLLRRDWLSDAFLQLRNWYVPGYGSGALSNGTDAAGVGNFALVPTAFIAIKNLSIKAQWSSDDKAALDASASLGPFALFGRTFDAATNTLSVPGMQLVAWVCETQSPLPPAADPTMGVSR
jgi:hypothetical protein